MALHDDLRKRVRLRAHDERALVARRIDRRQRAALIGERAVDPVRFAAVDDFRDDVVEEKRRRQVVVEVAAQLRVHERRIRFDAELAQERREEERLVFAVAVALRSSPPPAAAARASRVPSRCRGSGCRPARTGSRRRLAHRARGFDLRISSATPAIVSRESSSSWKRSSAHFATSLHDAYSVTCTTSDGSYQSGVPSSTSFAATLRRSQIQASPVICAGLLTCSGRPFGQSRRCRIRRVGTRVLKSNSSA